MAASATKRDGSSWPHCRSLLPSFALSLGPSVLQVLQVHVQVHVPPFPTKSCPRGGARWTGLARQRASTTHHFLELLRGHTMAAAVLLCCNIHGWFSSMRRDAAAPSLYLCSLWRVVSVASYFRTARTSLDCRGERERVGQSGRERLRASGWLTMKTNILMLRFSSGPCVRALPYGITLSAKENIRVDCGESWGGV